jgi:hypothetical protein
MMIRCLRNSLDVRLERRVDVWNARKDAPLWLRAFDLFFSTLLYGGCAVVFVGCVYFLFVADPSHVDPSSLSRDTPLLTRLGFLGLVMALFVVIYAINRFAWGMVYSHIRR